MNTSIPIASFCRIVSLWFSFTNFYDFSRTSFNTAPSFPNQAQWNVTNDNEFDLASTSMTSNISSQAPKVNNHQKTAERMAEDESKFFERVVFLR